MQGPLVIECSFTRRIRQQVLNLFTVNKQLSSWFDVIQWVVQELKARSLKANMCKLAFTTTVYHIWLRRNIKIHNGQVE